MCHMAHNLFLLVFQVLIRTNASKASPELKRLVYIANTKFKSLKEMNDLGECGCAPCVASVCA